MRERINALRHSRVKCIQDARKVYEKIAAGTGSAEDRQEFDRLHAEADRLKTEADKLESVHQLQSAADDSLEPAARSSRRMTLKLGSSRDKSSKSKVKLKVGRQRLWVQNDSPLLERRSTEYAEAFGSYIRQGTISAALQTDVATAGGYLAPTQGVNEIIKEVDDLCFWRTLARYFPTTAPSLGIVSRTARLSSAAWGLETAPPTADANLKFGKRVWQPHWMSGEIVVSRDLLAATAGDLSALNIVYQEIARDCDYLEEQAYMTGDGINKPLGLFTASNDGIPTTRDYAGTNTTTALAAKTFIEARYKLKPKYRRSKSCVWLFHRDTIGKIMSLQDGSGRFLFEPAKQAGDMDMFLGIPVYESEFVPNTFSASAYVGLLGDAQQYYIAEMPLVQVQRRIETYASNNQDGFIYRRKLDGQPTLGEAFVRIQMAAS